MPSNKKDMGNKAKTAMKKSIVEDKTFGLKNKNKSKKVQNYVKQVVAATENSFTDKKKKAEEDRKKKEKEEKKKHEAEMKELFAKTIIQPKVPFGVDPKTIACEHFKQGQCKKNASSCKFSHDKEICFGKKKTAKLDVTVDMYAAKKKKPEEDLAITDPEELKRAIEKKAKQQACETHIICKHFLNAIERKTYGWFWECPDAGPSGDGCKYRHALPPGYVFKKDMKKKAEEDDEDDGVTQEERLEELRRGIGPGSMMVSEETFKEWKAKRTAERDAIEEKEKKAAQKIYRKGGKTSMTGRQLFEFDASIFVDDLDAGGDDVYKREFEDAAALAAAKASGPAGAADAKPVAEEAAPPEVPAEAAAPAVELPEGIEENLFLDEDLDDLPSDDD